MSFPKYQARKDSCVEWIGEVPRHWAVQPLKRHARLLTEKTDRRDQPVALENIESWTGRFLPTETEFEGDGVAFESGDVLFGKLRPYLAKTLVAESAGEAVGDFLVMRPAKTAESRFLAYQLRSREVVSIIDGSTFGSKMPRASWDFVGSMPAPLPPVGEQVSIVAFLDRETAKIDALVEEQRRLIELLKEKRQAVISQAVTKGLNPNVTMKDSGVDWLGAVPTHWGVGSLSRIAERVVVGIAEAATHAYADEGTPILRSTNVRAGRIVGEILYVTDEFADGRGSKLIKAGDLVTVRTGSAGVTAVVPPHLDGCQCFTMLITSLAEGSNADFYCYLLNSVSSQRYFSLEGWGTAQVNISVPILKALPVTIPPLSEQQAIVGYLDAATERMDRLVAEAEAAMALLGERRSALISAAVTGKIDVRSTVPEVQRSSRQREQER